MLDTGVMLVHMNMTRGQTYRIRDVFTPFRNGAERFFLAAVLFDVFLVIAGIPAIAGVLYFYKTGVSGLSGALLAAGSILGLIFTFYVLLTYRMVFFFLLDHPHLSVRDAFRTCRKFMRGRRRKLLYILFSFLGWGALAICSFGIAALWISPYMTQTLLTFYLDGTGRTGPDSRPLITIRRQDASPDLFFDILWQIRSSDLPFVYTQLPIISHQEEFTMNEKDGAIRDASVLGVPKMLILGLQHMFAMFGATILVPILVNSYFGEDVLHVQVTLICAGIGTLFFHLCSKFKVPAFLGSSFAFLGGFATIANMDSGVFADMPNADKLSYACGGIVVAGLLYLILALIIKLVGVKKVMRFLPPVVTGPIIICIGLSLAGSAINNASTNWLLALIALVTIIVFNIWGRGMFKIIPILMGVIISYIAALIFNAMGMTNADGSAILSFTDIANASWVGVPAFSLCKFNLSAILVMAPIALATMMEHIGDISAISATVDQNFIEDPGLHRTLIGDGLATSLSALVGGPANTTYGENTGVLELSKVYDPKVIRIAACYAIILSFIPKMAAVIGSMPSAIIGGVSFMLYGMISAIGVRNVVENHVDFTQSRNLIIAGVIFVCGLGFSDGLTFTIAGTSVTLTALAVAAIAGIFLNAILPGNDYHFGKDITGDANRGIDMKPNLHEDTSYADTEE